MSENDDGVTDGYVAPLYRLQRVYVQPGPEPKPSRPWVHIALFLVTVVTTTLAYAFLAGVPLTGPGLVKNALPFSLTFLTILAVHEFGHYFASRSWGVRATLPYFIPVPPGIGIGTFGAVIKTKSRIPHRRALLDIGTAGPLAGFVAAFLASVVGLSLSEAVSAAPGGGGRFILGDSLVFSALVRIIWGELLPSQDVMLHPVAFAGWLGFFVTTLNLLPIGQLDGGHVIFALWGGKQRGISVAVVVAAVGLGLTGVVAPIPWLVFCGFAVAITGIAHPPVHDPHVPLDSRRRAIGYLALMVFMLCFTPVPFSVELP